MIDADDVLNRINERMEIVQLLAELTERQFDAIASGQMSALMQLLSQKQEPIARLGDISRELRIALEDTANESIWCNETQRAACRQRHKQSEMLLREVLQREAECGEVLQQQRQSLGEELLRVDNSSRASSSYARASATSTTGGSLDLSSQ